MADAYDFDLIVIGSGPAGQHAALEASKAHKRVALVEKKSVVGGVCVNAGAISSKALREAVLRLSGRRVEAVRGAPSAAKTGPTMWDFVSRIDEVVSHEIESTRRELRRHDITMLEAEASFADPHVLRLELANGQGTRKVSAAFVVIAVGTHSTTDLKVLFDGQSIFVSDDVLGQRTLPRTLAVVGAGLIGIEYACIYTALGVRVTILDKREQLLPFVDVEIIDCLREHLERSGATLRLGAEVAELATVTDGGERRVKVTLASGETIVCDKALYSVGRTGATDRLSLRAAGLAADARGRLAVDEHYRTSVPHIYAVGDVVGFPSLASTAMEQGRLAACHALGLDANRSPALFPYGIHTIPEISMVGKTEEQLKAEGVPYEVGIAEYTRVVRGQILGDGTGMLKLVFHRETKKLLSVHIIGEGACELVHIGQAVMAFGGTIDYFARTVFNYPTLAECYKTAALDGYSRLG